MFFSTITITLFLIYLLFQLLYIVVPLIYKNKIHPDTKLPEKGISVLVPAYNEEVVIESCINAIVNVNYEHFEAIIINDGSKDSTFSVLKEKLDLESIHREKAGKLFHNAVKGVYRSKTFPKVYVIDKENGGKADALNTGIEYSTHEIVITLDADSILDIESLKYINAYFYDSKIAAAGGTVLVAQGVKNEGALVKPVFNAAGLIKHQIIHYFYGFYIKKLTQSAFNSIVVIAGAFGAFRKNILFDVKGYRNTVGEDMDITLKIHRYIRENRLQSKLIYAPEAVCYTECPSSLRDFLKQRFRWQRAFMDCVFEYWKDLFKGLSTPLSLFFLVDGLLLGTLTSFPTLLAPFILIAAWDNAFLTLVLFLVASIIATIENFISLSIGRNYGFSFSVRNYLYISFFLFIDALSYRFLALVTNTVGTVMSLFEDGKWDNIQRSGQFSVSFKIEGARH
ncbi:MAG: glycosyltransferase [Clostridia bacterium]|nr:glycosyltransferase [Clostridia bacterium]